MFAVKLDNIIIGAKKIHVNLPRFQREKHFMREERPKTVQKSKSIKRESLGEVCFEVSEEDMNKLNKMFGGDVKKSCCTHMVQEWLSM